MPRRRLPRPPGSRARLLAAAAAEFAARGFAATGVDRIARRARVNKAMIYYHFRSKEALYREILRDAYLTVARRVAEILASNLSPDQKLGRFIDTIVREGEARPYFPPMMLREIAEGGPHLDRETLKTMSGLLRSVRSILTEGERDGLFRHVHPLVAHFAMIGPIIIFLASAPIRAEMRRAGLAAFPDLDSASFARHLHEAALRAFSKD